MGHASDMIRRVLANRAMQKGGQYFEKAGGILQPSDKKFNPDFSDKPDAVKNSTRKRIAAKIEKDKRRDTICLIIFIISVLIASLFLLI